MRVYLDGCFDLAHYGHFNAMRQARSLGSHLTVGIVSDAEVAKYKAPCVLTTQERCELVKSVRWVNEIIPGVPHTLDAEFTEMLRIHCGISMIVNGNDQYDMPGGVDPYQAAKNAGMYWAIARTPGISTTQIVRALLTNTSVPRNPSPARLPTWQPRASAVYVDGAFDCLHLGHIAFLKEARKHGACVVAGVHADEAVHARRGRPPVMCLDDRARTLADCKYVDGVLPGSPTTLTHAFLKAIGAVCVARGAVHETCLPDRDRYKAVADKLVYVLSPSSITLSSLQRRVWDKRDLYERKTGLEQLDVPDTESDTDSDTADSADTADSSATSTVTPSG
jgi:ethanolamine-phosphate cytidylyltransferase